MAAEELCLSVRGVTLTALRWNRGAPIRVLATHGWLDNAASFMTLAPLLPHCELVALDLPGHGRSAHRGAATMQYFVEYVADVVVALDALGWEKAVLMGHSMGAGIMSCTAGLVPDRVQALCLLEGVAPQPSEPEKILETLGKAVAQQQRMAGDSAGYPDMAAAVEARKKGYWPLSDAVSAAILERALTRGADGVLRWHTDARLRQASALKLVPEQLLALLHAVRAPTLMLGATQGLFSNRETHRIAVDAIAGLEYRCLPGSHHAHLEPDTAPAIANAVHEFLDRHFA